MSSTSRILSHLFKNSCRECFTKRGLNYQSKGTKTNAIIRYFDYLKSSQGKKAFSIIIPSFSLAASISLILGDWFCLNTYINNFQTLDDESKRRPFHKLVYFEDRPLQKSDNMARLSYEVAKDLKLTDKSANEIRLFQSNSPYPIPLGILKNVQCTPRIGYPFFMDWNSTGDVNLENAVVKIRWNPVTAKGFDFVNTDLTEEEKENFVFSDQARKFVLGKSLMDTDNSKIVHRMLIPIIGINGAHVLILTLKKRFEPFFRVMPARLALYAMASSLFLLIMVTTYTLDNIEREYENIHSICSLGEDYRAGGVEYYSKIKKIYELLRSKAKYGDFYFTEDGELEKLWYEFDYSSVNTLQSKKEYCESLSTDEEFNIFEIIYRFR